MTLNIYSDIANCYSRKLEGNKRDRRALYNTLSTLWFYVKRLLSVGEFGPADSQILVALGR